MPLSFINEYVAMEHIPEIVGVGLIILVLAVLLRAVRNVRTKGPRHLGLKRSLVIAAICTLVGIALFSLATLAFVAIIYGAYHVALGMGAPRGHFLLIIGPGVTLVLGKATLLSMDAIFDVVLDKVLAQTEPRIKENGCRAMPFAQSRDKESPWLSSNLKQETGFNLVAVLVFATAIAVRMGRVKLDELWLLLLLLIGVASLTSSLLVLLAMLARFARTKSLGEGAVRFAATALAAVTVAAAAFASGAFTIAFLWRETLLLWGFTLMGGVISLAIEVAVSRKWRASPKAGS